MYDQWEFEMHKEKKPLLTPWSSLRQENIGGKGSTNQISSRYWFLTWFSKNRKPLPQSRYFLQSFNVFNQITTIPVIFDWHEVAENIREPGIYRGYRPEEATVLQCITSVFAATNETLNFWTHFLPSVYFFWRSVQLSDHLDFAGDPYTWPLLFYMVTACLYPFMSCVAHAFSALSKKARHICFFLDYSAISLYSFGAAILYRGYVLPDELMNSAYADIFLYGCIFNSIVSTTLACGSRFIESVPLQRILRLGAFSLPYLWDTAPLLYRLLGCSQDVVAVDNVDVCGLSSFYHRAQLLAVAAASFFYASHLPERIFPGRFDFMGHSHNLLHIFGVLATALQMEGALLDMESRKPVLVGNGWALEAFWSGVAPAAVALLNMVIVMMFSFYVCKFYNHTDTEKLKLKSN